MTQRALAPGEAEMVVVGAGIVGLAVARELNARRPRRTLAVIEKASDVGTGQTGANSGVVHAGIYYAPGSLKARTCVTGARELLSYCERHEVPYERSGKLIVARNKAELPRLGELERRGRANGVSGLRMLYGEELRELEPHCRGVAALHSPDTAVVDFGAVARTLAGELERATVRVATGCEVREVAQSRGRIVLRHEHGETRARFVVFCAGAAADVLARRAGAPANPHIVPFRGSYLRVRNERTHLVRGLIYPVPDPALPFLGVHLSRHVDGTVTLGPSALLWPRGPLDVLWPGTLRLARRWWRTGLRELRWALSRRAFAAAAADYVPELRTRDLVPGFHGVRAQAVARDGRLVDDFVVSETERALHLRNAPSPAATSSLALARLIADRVEQRLA